MVGAAAEPVRTGVIGPDGRRALPWLETILEHAVGGPPAHAILIHGPEGVGTFELAIALAQAGLCEAERSGPSMARPCGRCAACRLVQAGSHPDLRVIVPEALGEALGWSALESAEAPDRSSKAKPSREIKVDAIRGAVGFAQTTSARGRGKSVVLHPAERLNGVAANTLLKTLEEPPGDARFILSTAAPDALLATVRSRCRQLAVALPLRSEALDWLAAQGVSGAADWLAATGGQPQTALALAREGIDPGAWQGLPAAVARGQGASLAGWPLPRAIDALLKLCHDLTCASAGAAPRYFVGLSLPKADPVRLHRWHAVLLQAARHAEHPWNAGLMVESLVEQGRAAIGAPDGRATASPGVAPGTARR